MKNLKPFFFTVIAIATLNISLPALAADDANGKKLYHQGCTKCHDTSIHTRPNTIIFSKKALVNRIKFCDTMAGNHFNDAQVKDIAEYLNNSFYKFDD